jgi:hypothetical protein
MKSNYIIKYVLSGVAHLWLLNNAAVIVLMIVFWITDWDGYLSKSSERSMRITNTFENGYPVPVVLTVAMPPDTIVKYSKENSNGELRLTKKSNYRYEKADSILKDTANKKRFFFSAWVVEPQHGYDPDLQTKGAPDKFTLFDSTVNILKRKISASVESSYFLETSIKLKSKRPFQNFMFALNTIIAAISSLLISFNIARLAHYILKYDTFLSVLHKKVKIIGLIIIISQIASLLLGFLYSRWFGLVRLEKVSNIENIGGYDMSVQFIPSTYFNFSTFLFGLSFIILSSLFKQGYKLQQENALTI